MENSSGVGVGLVDCCDCGSEHGSTRLESPHGVAATPASDHSTSNLSMSPQPQLATSVGDHHYVAAALSANAKIIERAGIKENTLLPNGRIKQHRSDENGLINHHVLQTGGPPSTDTSSGLLSNTGVNTTSSSIGGGAEKADDINKYERCPTQNASSKNVTNNQSSSSSTISGGDAHDKKKDEVEDGITGDGSKPLLSSGVSSPSSMQVQSRTYQSHGDQVDSISQQIDTLNISSSTRDNTSETTTIINNTTAACECDGHHVDVTTANSDDDDDDEGTAGLVPCSHSAHDADCCHTVAVVNDDNNNNGGECPLEYRVYQCELQMADIMRLITRDLSEPYSIYTYRYFIHNWPKLCFLDTKVPWGSIFRSGSLWSLCILLFSNSWLYFFLLTFMPTYMEVILGLDMDDNGLYSSLPYLAGTITSLLGGVVADYMINRGVKINTTRKFVTAIGLLPESLTLLAVAFLGCRSKLVILMFVLTYAFGGIADSGTAITIIDIAPRYAGAIYGIANCAGTFSGVLAPLVTGYIIDASETLEQWKKAFFVACGVNVIGVSIFLIFAKIEKAPWSDGIIDREANAKLIDPTSNDQIHTKNYGSIAS